MLNQTDLERERYESRRKSQLDYSTGMKVARLDGREEGRKEGLKEGEIAKIHLCERLLKRPETPAEQLAGLSLEDLERMAQDLEAALRAGTP